MNTIIYSILEEVGRNLLDKAKDAHTFNNIFSNAAENILALDHDTKHGIYSQLRNLFSEKNIEELSTVAKRKYGMDILKVIRMQLSEILRPLDVTQEEKNRFIDSFIEQILEGIKTEAPHIYEEISLDEHIADNTTDHKQMLSNQSKILQEVGKVNNPLIYGKTIPQVEEYLRLNTECKLDLSFFDFGEQELDKKIKNGIENNTEVYIQGRSKEELLYYVLRVIKELEYSYVVKTLIVYKKEDWEKLSSLAKGLIIIPFFSVDFGTSIIPGNTNIFIYTNSSVKFDNKEIKVPQRTKSNLYIKLKDFIKDDHKTSRIIEQTSGLFPALQRHLFKTPIPEPQWLKDNIKLLIPALFLGHWTYFIGDDEVVKSLIGQSVDEYAQNLHICTKGEEPFIVDLISRRDGAEFSVVDLPNAWNYLIDHITETDLSKLEKIILKVLLDATAIHHSVPISKGSDKRLFVNKKYSQTLKKGLTQSLVYLSIEADGRYKDFVKNTVKKVLASINTKEQWEELSEILPLLIEAAPEEVLDELDVVISQDNTPFWSLFTSPEYYYTKVLHALEKMLFSSSNVSKSVDILFKIANKKIQYKLANKPEFTLQSVFCAWYQEIDISIDSKINLLDKYLAYYDEVAWGILKAVLPSKLGGVYEPLSKPEIILYDAKQKVTTNKQIVDTYKAYFNLAIKYAALNLNKWADLFQSCLFIKYGLKDEAFSGILSALKASNSDVDKYAFSKVLRNRIYLERYMPKGSWLNEGELTDLEKNVFNNITYENKYYEHLYLFESDIEELHPTPLQDDGFHNDEYQRKHEEHVNKCRKALEELRNKNLLTTDKDIVEFALLLKDNQSLVGKLLSELHIITPEKMAAFMLLLYQNRLKDVLFWFAWDIYKNNGSIAIKELLQKNELQGTTEEFKFLLLKSVQIDDDWIEYISRLDNSVAQYYWQHITPLIDNNNMNLYLKVLDNLIKYKNYEYALLISINEDKIPVEKYIYLLQKIEDDIDNHVNIKYNSYHIYMIFEKLYDKVVYGDKKFTDAIINLEMFFIDIFYGKPPKFLDQRLRTDPYFSADLLKVIYKTENAEKKIEPSQKQREQALRTYDIFLYVKFCPAFLNNTESQIITLEKWCEDFVNAVEKNKQREIGLSYLARFLASSPIGKDGVFPHEIVRPIIEKYYTKDFEESFVAEVFNLRGTHVVNAGFEEKSKALIYKGYADKLGVLYPKTVEILLAIYREYSKQSCEERQVAEHEY